MSRWSASPVLRFIGRHMWQFFIGAVRKNVALGMTWDDALDDAVAPRFRNVKTREARLRKADRLLHEPAIAHGLIAYFDKMSTALPPGVEPWLEANIRVAEASGKKHRYWPLEQGRGRT